MWTNQKYNTLFEKPSFQVYRQQMKNRIANMLMKNIELDRLKVKHLEVTTKHTLTTPKVALTESGLDPANNGELTMNGGIIRGKSNAVVKNFGGVLANDAVAKTSGGITSTTANVSKSASGGSLPSVTLTPSATPNYVHIVAWVIGIPNYTETGTVTAIIKKSGVTLATGAGLTGTLWQQPFDMVDYLDSNVAGATTYDNLSTSGYAVFTGGIVARVIHL